MLRRRAVAALLLLLVGLLPVGPGTAPAAAASPRPANFATAGDVVDWSYEHLLGREPDPTGLRFWAGRLDAGGDPVDLLASLAASGEYDAWMGQLIRAYRTAYARGADLGGLQYWLSRRAPGSGSFRQSAFAAFLAGPEFAQKYGGTTDREFVRRIYVNALGREPDQGGLDYWTGRVAAVGRGEVIFQIGESPEHRGRRRNEVVITGDYVSLLGRLADPGALAGWVDFLNRGGARRQVQATIWGSSELAGRLATVPTVTTSVLVGGLSIPWGIAFTPDGTMLFTQRAGTISARLTDGTVRTVSADLRDLFARSEGGLLDIAVDPGFASNRRFYTCMNRATAGGSALDVAVVAWTVDASYTAATRVGALVNGLPVTSGRHSGCRILPDPAAPGVLYIATGDAAVGPAAQDLAGLGGKVLRVSSTTGEGVAGNPFIASANANTRRIFNYGHRNLQGLAHRIGTNQIWTAEHGPERDDEINVVLPGRNYGWNPVPGGYNESVPMTDLQEFPDAVGAVWSSGSPTVATSGMAFLDGCAWGAYDDHAAVALLKGSELRIHAFTTSGLDLGLVTLG
ncbi:MAG: PQQ-dependent sugar dehydrogenase, partial [Actinomycetota bacterium]|nr:PQQ-dependent sugar dehydrogenase [Actinomycetota bacterium]